MFQRLKSELISVSIDVEVIDDAPMDVLRRSLSIEAFQCLQKNDYILERLKEIAYDASDLDGTYNCRKCGNKTLVLNFFFSEGVSKCFYCGDYFTAGYTDCSLCGSSRTVTYDSLNIKYNQNIMSGYCYDCDSRVKVYKCPICGMVHTYSGNDTLIIEYDECCIDSFRDRYII